MERGDGNAEVGTRSAEVTTENAAVGTRSAEVEARAEASCGLMQRTKRFALEIVRLVDGLPRSRAAEVMGRQLLRAGTSVAANYRSARRARSRKEFIAKLGIVEEEADESLFWLELLAEAGLGEPERTAALRDEANQLVAMTVSSIRTARQRGAPVPRSAFRAPRSVSPAPRSAFRAPRSI